MRGYLRIGFLLDSCGFVDRSLIVRTRSTMKHRLGLSFSRCQFCCIDDCGVVDRLPRVNEKAIHETHETETIVYARVDSKR